MSLSTEERIRKQILKPGDALFIALEHTYIYIYHVDKTEKWPLKVMQYSPYARSRIQSSLEAYPYPLLARAKKANPEFVKKSFFESIFSGSFNGSSLWFFQQKLK